MENPQDDDGRRLDLIHDDVWRPHHKEFSRAIDSALTRDRWEVGEAADGSEDCITHVDRSPRVLLRDPVELGSKTVFSCR